MAVVVLRPGVRRIELVGTDLLVLGHDGIDALPEMPGELFPELSRRPASIMDVCRINVRRLLMLKPTGPLANPGLIRKNG